MSAGSGGRSRDGGHADGEEAAEEREAEPARHARCGLGAASPSEPRAAPCCGTGRAETGAVEGVGAVRVRSERLPCRQGAACRRRHGVSGRFHRLGRLRQPQSPRRLPGKAFLRRRPAWRVSSRAAVVAVVSATCAAPHPPTAPSGPRPRSSSPRAGRRSRPRCVATTGAAVSRRWPRPEPPSPRTTGAAARRRSRGLRDRGNDRSRRLRDDGDQTGAAVCATLPTTGAAVCATVATTEPRSAPLPGRPEPRSPRRWQRSARPPARRARRPQRPAARPAARPGGPGQPPASRGRRPA